MTTQQIRDAQQVMESIQSQIDSLARRVSSIEGTPATPHALSTYTTPVTISNSSGENDLRSVSLSGNSIRTSNLVEIFALGKAINESGSAANFSFRLYYGSGSVLVGPFSIASGSPANGKLFTIRGYLSALNQLTSSQRLVAHCMISGNHGVFSTANVFDGWAVGTLSQDSTINQTIKITTQHGTASPLIKTELMIFKVGYPQVAA